MGLDRKSPLDGGTPLITGVKGWSFPGRSGQSNRSSNWCPIEKTHSGFPSYPKVKFLTCIKAIVIASTTKIGPQESDPFPQPFYPLFQRRTTAIPQAYTMNPVFCPCFPFGKQGYPHRLSVFRSVSLSCRVQRTKGTHGSSFPYPIVPILARKSAHAFNSHRLICCHYSIRSVILSSQTKGFRTGFHRSGSPFIMQEGMTFCKKVFE